MHLRFKSLDPYNPSPLRDGGHTGDAETELRGMSGDRTQERYALQARFAQNTIAYPDGVELCRRLCSYGHIDKIFQLRTFCNHSPIR